jgi:hypothetical protein
MNSPMTGAHEWARWILTTKSLTPVERHDAKMWFVATYGISIERFKGRAAA